MTRRGGTKTLHQWRHHRMLHKPLQQVRTQHHGNQWWNLATSTLQSNKKIVEPIGHTTNRLADSCTQASTPDLSKIKSGWYVPNCTSISPLPGPLHCLFSYSTSKFHTSLLCLKICLRFATWLGGGGGSVQQPLFTMECIAGRTATNAWISLLLTSTTFGLGQIACLW